MTPALKAIAGLCLALCCTPLWAGARGCEDGRVSRGTSEDGDAIDNFQCATLGQVYCRVAKFRDAGLEQEDAVKRTAEWFARRDQVGSHVRTDLSPIISIAAGEVYRNKERAPGATFYRAVYSCGLAKRLAHDAEAMRKGGAAFDAGAARCEAAHGRDDPFPNSTLRKCLRAVVDHVAPAGAAR